MDLVEWTPKWTSRFHSINNRQFMYWKGCTLIYKMSVIRHRVVFVLFRYWPIQNGMDRPNDSSARLMLGPPVTSSSTKDQKAIRKLKMEIMDHNQRVWCLNLVHWPLISTLADGVRHYRKLKTKMCMNHVISCFLKTGRWPSIRAEEKLTRSRPAEVVRAPIKNLSFDKFDGSHSHSEIHK